MEIKKFTSIGYSKAKIDQLIEQTKRQIYLLEELKESIEYERCDYIIIKADATDKGYMLYKKKGDLHLIRSGSYGSLANYLKKIKIPPDNVYRQTSWKHIISSDKKSTKHIISSDKK